MTFSDDQVDRYARQIVLKEIGGTGQQKLLAARITLIGAGGIGAPAIQYLAAAGVGSLTVIDDDTVSLANLQRQILFGVSDIGRGKTEVSSEAVARLNPDVHFTGIAERMGADNAAQLLDSADIVLDGSDNFATRLAVSDACVSLGVPLVSAALGMFQGQIGLFRGHEEDQACYRCFVGDAFDADDCDTCAELGVLGAMAGIMGSWAAMEIIRGVTGFGVNQAGKVQIFDGLASSMRSVRIIKDPACKGCGVA